MKAAICYEYGKPLVIEELDIDPPQQGEVKVRLAATAICHSDVHLIRGEWVNEASRLPIVAGHESAGIVEEVGEGVTRFRRGDHVVMSLLRSCGGCFYCASGHSYLCDGYYALNDESRFHNRRGETVWQGIRTAGFAEQTIVDQSQLVRIADDIPLDSASLLACGVITGLGAVVNTAQVEPGRTVAVIGVGGVGLNSVQGARLSGANPIVAIDLLDNKLAAARAFGATHTINASTNDVAKEVRELTAGRGVDYAFVAVGSARAVEQAFDLIRRGGTVTLVGIPEIDATIPFSPTYAVWKSQRVLGSSMGSTILSTDVPRLIDLYRTDRLKLDELITKRYPLEDINEAIECMERGEALRNVIVFE